MLTRFVEIHSIIHSLHATTILCTLYTVFCSGWWNIENKLLIPRGLTHPWFVTCCSSHARQRSRSVHLNWSVASWSPVLESAQQMKVMIPLLSTTQAPILHQKRQNLLQKQTRSLAIHSLTAKLMQMENATGNYQNNVVPQSLRSEGKLW